VEDNLKWIINEREIKNMTLRNVKKKILKLLPRDIRQYLLRRSLNVNFEVPLEGIGIKRITKDFKKVQEFLYEIYLNVGYIQPNNLKMRIIPQHSNPGSTAFIAECLKDGRIIGTISVFCGDKGSLPMEQGFEKEVRSLRDQGRKVCEIGALAIHPDYRGRNQDLLFIFNKLCILYAMRTLNADDALITTHPKNEYVYTDLFFFDRIGYLKSFSYVKDLPAVALRLNLNVLKARTKLIYKNFKKAKNIHDFVFEKELRDFEEGNYEEN
jgi:hypothetical protein